MERGWPELGQAIRRRRREARLSQERLAELAGLHWTYLSEVETARVNPSIGVVRQIAGALGVKMSELVAEAEGIGR